LIKKDHRQNAGDGLTFSLNSRDMIRIDDCSTLSGGYSPSE